ncbi:MAG: hypothetical protein ACO3FW_08275 [Burkholderiaceae bacterium]
MTKFKSGKLSEIHGYRRLVGHKEEQQQPHSMQIHSINQMQKLPDTMQLMHHHPAGGLWNSSGLKIF